MTIEFRFNGATKQLIVTPENARDKILLQLFCDEFKTFKADLNGADALVVEPKVLEEPASLPGPFDAVE